MDLVVVSGQDGRTRVATGSFVGCLLTSFPICWPTPTKTSRGYMSIMSVAIIPVSNHSTFGRFLVESMCRFTGGKIQPHEITTVLPTAAGATSSMKRTPATRIRVGTKLVTAWNVNERTPSSGIESSTSLTPKNHRPTARRAMSTAKRIRSTRFVQTVEPSGIVESAIVFVQRLIVAAREGQGEVSRGGEIPPFPSPAACS